MATATTVSLAKFTESVQAAVKAAVAKNPKFKMDPPDAISVSYLIRGIPPAEEILAHATLAEVQAFADDVASHLSQAHPDILTRAGVPTKGAVISVGGHLIIGIPPVTEVYTLER